MIAMYETFALSVYFYIFLQLMVYKKKLNIVIEFYVFSINFALIIIRKLKLKNFKYGILYLYFVLLIMWINAESTGLGRGK